LKENIDQLNLNDLVYFKIEPSIESSRNIILRGKTTGYCILDKCSTENIRGNIINAFIKFVISKILFNKSNFLINILFLLYFHIYVSFWKKWKS